MRSDCTRRTLFQEATHLYFSSITTTLEACLKQVLVDLMRRLCQLQTAEQRGIKLFSYYFLTFFNLNKERAAEFDVSVGGFGRSKFRRTAE